ncbi:TrkH family potassium uptake protein [Rubrobacter tropicus]|uniref:TrkH family potassium uptake protein n=1 Tax=Rubrobacter tropicus TaxID=2653851 RepID=A0A6G8QCT7_9ACTN|nr:potassium transporter TrkG [Rubrobacter tropicus]QIN84252.1 TrkH family potassium uptake protein [Rubrobacter tropicus]
MHPRVIANALGAVYAAGGAAMLVPALYALLVRDGNALSFAAPALATVVAGAAVFFLTRSERPYVSGRDVYMIVTLGWLGVGAVGAIPFVLSGLMGPVDAFFESMAGFTTTGASTIGTPEEVAPSLLLWRSLSQWAGGIGIVLLFVAVAPLVGFGATQLYSAEAADPVPDRMTTRIADTAKILALVYGSLTAGGVVALFLAGMNPFDAVNHALTTVSTGGYSTRTESIAAFDSVAVELAVTAGMVLSGVNFALYFRAARGRLGLAVGNAELLVFLGILAVSALMVSASLYTGGASLPSAGRDALFQTASLLTGTGFVTADWKAWSPFCQGLLMLLLTVGGSAGSTSGGLKVVRVMLLARHAWQQVFKMVHPQAVTLLRFGHRVIPERLRIAFLGFFFVYVLALVTGTLLLTLHGVPLGASFGSIFACINIAGTALGPVGDAPFFAGLPASAKVLLTFFMLLGRLELFTVLVLLTPEFWRS